MKQIVRLSCVICREPIDTVDEGQFCKGCDYPVHKACAQVKADGGDPDICPECGVDVNKAAKRARRAAEKRDDIRSGSSPYPISKLCPGCGHDKYEKRRAKGWVAFTDDRICKRCGTRYTPPTPLWAALIFIIGGFFIALAGLAWLLLLLLRMEPDAINTIVIDGAIAVAMLGMGGLSVLHGFRSLAQSARR